MVKSSISQKTSWADFAVKNRPICAPKMSKEALWTGLRHSLGVGFMILTRSVNLHNYWNIWMISGNVPDAIEVMFGSAGGGGGGGGMWPPLSGGSGGGPPGAPNGVNFNG